VIFQPVNLNKKLFDQFSILPKGAKYESDDRLFTDQHDKKKIDTNKVVNVKDLTTQTVVPNAGVTLKTTKTTRDMDHKIQYEPADTIEGGAFVDSRFRSVSVK